MRYDASGQKGSFRTGVNLALGPGATVPARVEVDAPLLYANRGHPMAKSCPPVLLLKAGRCGKTFLEVFSPVRIRRVISTYPKISYNFLTAITISPSLPSFGRKQAVLKGESLDDGNSSPDRALDWPGEPSCLRVKTELVGRLDVLSGECLHFIREQD